MIPTAATNPANNQTSSSAIIGITALILEGRALSDDNFIIEDSDSGSESSSSSSSSSSGRNVGVEGRAKYSENIHHVSGTKISGSSNLSSSSSSIWTSNNPVNNLSSSSGYYSSSSTSQLRTNNNDTADATLQHFQRLRQKLGQLRQSSPSTSWEFLSPEQGISVGSSRSSNSRSIPTEGDIEDNDDGELDPFIHHHHHQRRSSKSSIGGQTVTNDGNLLNTLQSLASTCLRHSTPRSFSKNRDWLVSSLVFSTSVNSCSSSSSSTLNSNSNNINTSGGNSNSSSMMKQMQKLNKNKSSSSKKHGGKIAPPKQGPHCDQFLKKMGLLKTDVLDAEEHICDMANLNEICYRWQIHCRQIDVIMSKSDPICIEVYLGPENHEILLEQWIIQQMDNNSRTSTPNMTLQSLCNAIRSQLYFSQITAWSDLIRKAKPYDREIMNNARIKTPCKPNGILLKPRLDIFYRIKAYDSTACFISKPNVHNFPNIVISENCLISVCLKSLPRLQGGIPKVDDIFASTSSPLSSIADNNDSSDHHHNSHFNSHAYHHQMSSSSGSRSPHLSNTNTEIVMVDDRLNLPCQEKGKHKCAFDEEDGSSDAVTESACSEGLSHREKQLMKYKKRILKRDKKSKKITNDLLISSSSLSTTSTGLPSSSSFASSLLTTMVPSLSSSSSSTSSSSSSSSMFSNKTIENCYQQKSGNESIIKQSKQYQSIQDNHHSQQQHDHQQKLNEIRSINSIRPPLYQATSCIAEGIQTNATEMISVGTQTLDSSMFYQQHQQHPICKTCGKDMQYICWSCEESKIINHSCGINDNVTNGSGNFSANGVETPQKIGKGDLLLQAIQRTPQRNKNQQHELRNNNNNNNNAVDFRTPTTTNSSDCQLCKRQKIRHNYNDQQQQQQHHQQSGESNILYRCNNGSSNYNQCSKSVANGQQQTLLPAVHNQQVNKCQRLYTNEKYSSSSKNFGETKCNCMQPLTVCLDKISDNGTTITMSNGHVTNDVASMASSSSSSTTAKTTVTLSCSTSSSSSSLSSSASISSPSSCSVTKSFICDDVNGIQQQMDQTPEIHSSTIPKNQLKPRLLEINNYVGIKSLKPVPKVNLTNIFCNSSSPIPINSGNESFSFDDDIISPEIPVQKSNSAPTLPNSPSLSPRFLKQAAIYKRRSRHLSDRSSERLSFCSDEQYSDEDLDGVYSPASSPIKTKVFMRSNLFGKRPLLGSLEESLLQKRFIPKTQVSGFKVLLGASGGFCPPQLTIPAATYCYEFSGQTISTPYMCEIRLPRKGYTIPRIGTVQATLLNPLGTVVRMFVIPYDFRDMPPMHQTFIRQRILAIDDNDNKTLIQQQQQQQQTGGGISSQTTTSSSSSSSSSNTIITATSLANNKTSLNSNNYNNNNKTNILLASGSQPEFKEISFSDQMRSLRYSIHLRFQTTRSGRLALHTDIRFLISRRTDCDTAAAHAKGALESPNELRTITITPDNPKYSARHECPNKI